MHKVFKDFLLGILAGISIAIGGVLFVICKTYIPASLDPLPKLIGALLFPVGLTAVCFFGFNLFTGKVGYLTDNKPNYLLFLLTIYIGNFVGAIAIGYLLIILQDLFGFSLAAEAVANAKINSVNSIGGSLAVFGKACLCGMLVYLAVFFYKTFNKTIFKVIGIFVPIALFVFCGFDHCIANMYYFAHGFWVFGYKEPLMYLNIALATLGNSVGAILLNLFINFLKKKRS